MAGAADRPFVDLYRGLSSPRRSALEALKRLDASEHFRKALAHFEAKPTDSLMAPIGCAILYHLTRSIGATSALEIGTYKAGGSEVLAMALAAEGGILVTLDPNGGRDELVRRTIASWPEPLQAATQYHNHSSATFFDQLEMRGGLAFDLILVDGYHEYGYALYDMTMAAKYARPGAVLVVDDFILPDVYWAARDFAQAHPDWTVVGDVFRRLDPDRPFESQYASLPGTNYLIFVAPDHVEIGPRPKVFTYPDLAISGVRAIDFTLAPDNPGGTLHAFAVLRASAPLPALPEQLHRFAKAEIRPGIGSQILIIDPPLKTERRQERNFELQLVFEPKVENRRLTLLQRPDLIPAG